jgi:hypothetical protein
MSIKMLLPFFKGVDIFIILILIFGGGVEGDRTSMKIYEPITGSYPCFRKLNGTHQIGCACR